MASAEAASFAASADGRGESIDRIRTPSAPRFGCAAHDSGLLHRAGGRTSERGFLAVCAVVFVASTALTIAWCAPTSAMRTMSMPGGWTMSMTWMRMPGQTWPGAATRFLGMWLVMMSAMMLPSFAPMLRRYRRDLAPLDRAQRGRLTMLAGAAYAAVWTTAGLGVYAVGAFLAAVAMRAPTLARAMPFAVGAFIVVAGAHQFTDWKARHLACCRGELALARSPRAGAPAAWRHGLALGWHCLASCAGLTAALLVVGAMDLRAMAAVTAAVTAERLAPSGQNIVRSTGAVVIVAGLLLLARAALPA